MDNPICKKVVSMLSLYIENKLDEDDKAFIEHHFSKCSECYRKYLEMHEIIAHLHFEYEKLLAEFERIETNKMFNIREYEQFYKNISPYIDDELGYDDSIKFRKYLLKSKPARAELANAYGLKNNIKNSVSRFKDNININFSKKVMKRIIDDNKYSFENVYKRAAVVLGFMISTLILVSLYMGFNYLNKSFAQDIKQNIVQKVIFPNDDDYVEFYFDDNNDALLTAK